MKATTNQIYAIFDEADSSTLSFAERLMALGIASRSDAKPHAMAWACARHNAKHKDSPCKIVNGREGARLNNLSAERAMQRVLKVCYPSPDIMSGFAKKKSTHKVDVVKQLVDKYSKLTKAEQRRFLASI